MTFNLFVNKLILTVIIITLILIIRIVVALHFDSKEERHE